MTLKQRWTDLIRLSVRSLNTWAALPQPGRMSVQPERQDGTMLVYKVTIPAVDKTAPNNADAVSQELTVEVDGALIGDPLSFTTDGGTTEVRITDGQACKLTLVILDDADPVNRSTPSTLEFVGKDTIAPSAPGAPTAELDHEE